jgi:3-(3-hydroxy-phenyl)propionate hydroxylase
MPYDYRPFPYRPVQTPDRHHKVAIVGAGPIGLALAIDLAQYGVPSVVLDDNNVVSVGSRAICWSKRSLEILDRLGVGAKCVEKGVIWKVGRTLHRDTEVWNFDLQPDPGHKMPAFVNLQQYYVEEYLVTRAMDFPDLIDLRWKNKVTALTQGDHVTLTVTTPDGPYTLTTDHLVACDGARSDIRTQMGLDFDGELFEERFLIADIEMTADFPSERRFWFEPPFHQGQSALLHKQPDNIYRIDLQLGWDADPEVERQPAQVIPRIEKAIGHKDFRLDWVSVYTFQCRRLAKFVHKNVIFAGDSAHIVSPFGARGGNGGLQDVDALGWRLAAVTKGTDPKILNAYDRERTYGADENLLNSSRTTRFMSPAPGAERLFRDAVLHLAARAPFARPLVNSGRLSVACTYPLDAPDDPALPKASRPGAVAPDAAVPQGWLIDQLGHDPVLLAIGQPAPQIAGLKSLTLAPTPDLKARYLGTADQALYLIRPDQIVAARWTSAASTAIAEALTAIWQDQP